MALTAGSESLGRLCGRARTGCVANKGIVAKIDFEPTTECYQKTRKYPAASAQAKRYSWQAAGTIDTRARFKYDALHLSFER